MKKGISFFKYLVLIFILNLLWCSNVFAYKVNTTGGKEIKWNTYNVTYHVNSSGGPSNSLSAIQVAMQTWTDVATSIFTFVYGGTTTSTAYGVNDRVNIVGFGSMGLTGTLAENTFWYYTGSGQMIDSDIKFNTDYPWATDGSPSAYDVQNVGTHELGHSLSLDDLYKSADSEKTMYGYAGTGETKKRTLDQDDIDGITYLYPSETLSVSLTADPSTGTAPLNATLSADVSGTATGTINYTFWWNCDDPGTSVDAVTAVCGTIPTPGSGTCTSNTNGMKCTAVTDDPKTVSNIDTTAGTYIAKVIAERGGVPPAESRVTIIVNAPADTTPPTPDPMTWSVQPYAAGSTSISMIATTATDSGSPPVSYYFDFMDSPTGGTGGLDSSWQSQTTYTNTGLQPNHQYGYREKARDSASNPNETSYSLTVYKYTFANAPGTAAFSDVTQTSIRANWTANGNRSGTGYYCENITKGTNSGWTTNTYWDSTGLSCGTSYSFRIKARNGDGIETGWTNLGSQRTQACSLSQSGIGVFRSGAWYLDYNGNGVWNGCSTDFCTTFGLSTDTPIAGDWNGDGRKEIGVKRGINWYLDYNGNSAWDGCVIDRCYTFGISTDIPVAGDWNNDGTDKIGVFRNGAWYLDYNGDGTWNGCMTDICISSFGLSTDIPVAGDWNGDGYAEIGVFRNGNWYLDYDRSDSWSGCGVDECYDFGISTDSAVVGDWNGSGFTKIGVKRGTAWYLDYNGNGAWNGCTTDRCYSNFGLSTDSPVAGNW